jgi:hypothetical protein
MPFNTKPNVVGDLTMTKVPKPALVYRMPMSPPIEILLSA